MTRATTTISTTPIASQLMGDRPERRAALVGARLVEETDRLCFLVRSLSLPGRCSAIGDETFREGTAEAYMKAADPRASPLPSERWTPPPRSHPPSPPPR